jgi:hypothetical protein
MRLQQVFTAASVFVGSLILSGFQTEAPKSAPTRHTFTATIHYKYSWQLYDPPVPIKYLENAPASNSTPEEALISQLSALHKRDYKWWLESWDQSSREELLHQQQASGEPIAIWFKSIQPTNISEKCSLNKWIVRHQYVILRYGCRDSISRAMEPELAVALKKDRGHWFATLDLALDPIFKYADGTNPELHVTPRD